MQSIKGCLIIIVFFIMSSISLTSYAQKDTEEDSQRSYIKQKIQYNRWKDMLISKTEIRYDAFELDDKMVSPWHIQRMQKIGKANRGSMVQYILIKSDDISNSKEILRISVTLCKSRTDALEGLVDHLLGIQHPDIRLIEKDTLIIGDLTVNIPGSPEAAIFFARGNILISIENAGQKITPDIRKLAVSLDEILKSVAKHAETAS